MLTRTTPNICAKETREERVNLPGTTNIPIPSGTTHVRVHAAGSSGHGGHGTSNRSGGGGGGGGTTTVSYPVSPRNTGHEQRAVYPNHIDARQPIVVHNSRAGSGDPTTITATTNSGQQITIANAQSGRNGENATNADHGRGGAGGGSGHHAQGRGTTTSSGTTSHGGNGGNGGDHTGGGGGNSGSTAGNGAAGGHGDSRGRGGRNPPTQANQGAGGPGGGSGPQTGANDATAPAQQEQAGSPFVPNGENGNSGSHRSGGHGGGGGGQSSGASLGQAITNPAAPAHGQRTPGRGGQGQHGHANIQFHIPSAGSGSVFNPGYNWHGFNPTAAGS